MEDHAGAATRSQAGHKPCTVEALPPLGPLVAGGAFKTKNPGHIEGPKSDGAPGREAGEDAEEGHAPQIAELAVVASETPNIANQIAEGP